MDSFETLKKRFEIFHKIKEELDDLDNNEGIDYESGSWTGIKLFSYSYYNAIYTHIIQERFNEYYYIDPFAGSGMTNIKGVEEAIPGSALLADTVKYPYTKLFLSDKDKDKLDLLEKRLDKLGENEDRYEIIRGKGGKGLEAKDSLPQIVSKIIEQGTKNPPFHTLAVIDPEGYKPPWPTMENLDKIGCDLLLTFFPHELGRTRSSGKEALQRYFNSENEKNWTKESYLENLKSIGFQNFKAFPCKKGGTRYASGYKIMVIWATKQEYPKWISAVDKLKKVCERNSGKQVEFANKLIKGDRTNLNEFFEEEDDGKGPLDEFIN